MGKILAAVLLAVHLPAISLAATVTFTSATDRGTYPATVKCDPETITVDLSSLGSDVEIGRPVVAPCRRNRQPGP